MPGGTNTTRSGKASEDAIEALEFLGFAVITAKQHKCGYRDVLTDRILIKQYPYKHVWGGDGRRDAFLVSPEWTGHLECKRQEGSGTCDLKPFELYVWALENPDTKVILLHTGKYWTGHSRGKGIIRYLKSKQEIFAARGQTFLIMDWRAFRKWAKYIWGN